MKFSSQEYTLAESLMSQLDRCFLHLLVGDNLILLRVNA